MLSHPWATSSYTGATHPHRAQPPYPSPAALQALTQQPPQPLCMPVPCPPLAPRHHHHHHHDPKDSYTSPSPASPTTTPYTFSTDTHHTKGPHGDAGGAGRGAAGEAPKEGGGGTSLGSRLRRNIRVGSSPHLGRSWEELPLLDIGVGVNLDMDQQQVGVRQVY